MKAKNIVTIVLLIFVIASVAFLVFNESRKEGNDNPSNKTVIRENPGSIETRSDTHKTDESGHKVIVYYFHGTKRCPTCRKFEAYATELMKTAFTKQQQSGKLEFRIVNVDEPQNKHFIYDYELTTKSVVLADFQNGEQTRWKNLDRIWKLVRDKEIFMDYIKDETENFMGELLYD